MAVIRRQDRTDKAISVILANEIVLHVFRSFANNYATSTTRLVGELGLGYDDVKKALLSLTQEKLIERDTGTSASSPGMDWFHLTEEGASVAKSLTSVTTRSTKRLK